MKCPHCITAFHEKWEILGIETEYRTNPDARSSWRIEHLDCPECGKLVVRLVERSMLPSDHPVVVENPIIVYPRMSSRPPCPLEVPAKYSGDYKEACLVLEDSPKASAALSRRILQLILRDEANVTAGHLSNEIEEAITKNVYPSRITGSLHAVREIGNFSAHARKSTHTGEVIPVEAGEAEWNLSTLEQLFDFHFVQDEVVKKMKQDLNIKLKDAGKNPIP